jgi:anti-anti-sigma regulatory factor
MASLSRTENRLALAINLELSHGDHGAAARIEIFESSSGSSAVLALRGWIEHVAHGRLLETLEGLSARGVRHLVLDWSQVPHMDYRLVAPLIEALTRFESRSATCALRGLSQHLRDRFRLAGCDPDRFGDAVAFDAFALEAGREWAS